MIIYAHFLGLTCPKPNFGFHFYWLSPEMSDKPALLVQSTKLMHRWNNCSDPDELVLRPEVFRPRGELLLRTNAPLSRTVRTRCDGFPQKQLRWHARWSLSGLPPEKPRELA